MFCSIVVDNLQQANRKFVTRARDVVRLHPHVLRIMHNGPTYFDIVAFFLSNCRLIHEVTNPLNASHTFVDAYPRVAIGTSTLA